MSLLDVIHPKRARSIYNAIIRAVVSPCRAEVRADVPCGMICDCLAWAAQVLLFATMVCNKCSQCFYIGRHRGAERGRVDEEIACSHGSVR